MLLSVKDNDFLNYAKGRHGYAVFAKVVDGMDVIDRIADVETGRREGYDDAPLEDVVIVSARRVGSGERAEGGIVLQDR